MFIVCFSYLYNLFLYGIDFSKTMKKKTHIPTKKVDEVSDPASDYKTIPRSKFSSKKEEAKRQKLFDRTSAPENFPDNCVTLDTFFSDLEDYIIVDRITASSLIK